MTYRITWDVLASGQPRPYADHYRHVRIKLEYFFAWLGDPNDPRSEWRPMTGWTDEKMRALLKTLPCGFTDKPPENPFSPVLQYLKETAPGVWEFAITKAYTG